MNQCLLQLTLQSDATFGRGNSIPGLVDRDVALDPDGCPYLHGRTIKGLLSESCADILYALGEQEGIWTNAADALFGIPGSKHNTQGILQVGHAHLPSDLRQAIQYEIATNHWTRNEIVESLTSIRQQTAIEVGGAPDPHTLRSVRVVIRNTVFHATLDFRREPTEGEQGLLAACVKGLRRAGTARNRGRGRVSAALLALPVDPETRTSTTLSDEWFTNYFASEVASCMP